MNTGHGGLSEAQRQADRIRILREELQELERQNVLELTPEQRIRFDEWSKAKLSDLAARYDVDTSVSQKRVSWGMRIASTLGALAICAAASRLVLIDAARDATALRSRHPDRNKVLVVPAVVGILFTTGSPATDRLPARSPRLSGHVNEIPNKIHVPRPFSDGFRDLSQYFFDEKRAGAIYRVHLHYGSLPEPGVTAVEFLRR